MAEPSERKIETWLAIVCGAAAGVSVITPAPPVVGWILLVVSCIAAALALRRHFLELQEKKNEPGLRRKMIGLIGMTVCGFGFVGSSVLYYWPQKPVPAPAPTPAISPPVSSTPTPPPANPIDESLPGFAFMAAFSMGDMPVKNRQYVFEYKTPEGSEIAFYISKSQRFTFLATDRNGESYPIEIPLGKYGIPILQPIVLYCDVGSGSNYAFMRVFINGRQIERRDLQFPIDMGSRQWINGTLGANAGNTDHAAFTMSGINIWTVTLNENDLSTMTQYLMSSSNITDNPTNLPSSPPVIPVPQSHQ